VINHFTGCLAAKFNREIRPAIPWVNLAHAGKEKILNRSLNGWDVPGVVDQRHRLREGCAEQPAGFDPARVKLRIDALETGKEPFDQLLLGQRKIFVGAFQVIAAVEQVSPPKCSASKKLVCSKSARKGNPAGFGRVKQ